MLQKFEIQGVHMTVDDSLHKYVTKKIGRLDKYLPRNLREAAHAEVALKEGKTKNHDHCTCEVTMYLPHETINIKESTMNIYAAVDIAEAKLKQQIKKYKDLHASNRLHRRAVARLRSRSAEA